jgi:hypothetical protein
MTHCFKTATFVIPLLWPIMTLFCLVLVILNYFILYFFSNHFIFNSYLYCVKYQYRLISKIFYLIWGEWLIALKRLHLYTLLWPIMTYLFSYFSYFKLFHPFISSNHLFSPIHIYCKISIYKVNFKIFYLYLNDSLL